jgi:hypothetical protein
MTASPKPFTANSPSYCVIAAPFGRLGILTELVEGSLMLSKIDYLPRRTLKTLLGNLICLPNLRGLSIRKRYGLAFKIYPLAKRKPMVS